MMAQVTAPVHLVELFSAQYMAEPNTGCWLWEAGCNRRGYGQLKGYGLAHRFSWELFRGHIPHGLCVCHHCDTPPCVNPSHLFVGTHADNARDRERKGRSNPQSGEMHWTTRDPASAARGEKIAQSKLLEDQVSDIRQRLASKSAQQKDLAAEYGVSKSLICMIARRKVWAHIP